MTKSSACLTPTLALSLSLIFYGCASHQDGLFPSVEYHKQQIACQQAKLVYFQKQAQYHKEQLEARKANHGQLLINARGEAEAMEDGAIMTAKVIGALIAAGAASNSGQCTSGKGGAGGRFPPGGHSRCRE